MAGILFFLLVGKVFGAEASGAREYKDNCARCHGTDAKGDGPDANEKPGYRPADLTQISRHYAKRFPRQDIYDIIDGGKRPVGSQSATPASRFSTSSGTSPKVARLF